MRPTAESAMSHPWMKVHGRRLLKRPLSDRRSGVSKVNIDRDKRLLRMSRAPLVYFVTAHNAGLWAFDGIALLIGVRCRRFRCKGIPWFVVLVPQ